MGYDMNKKKILISAVLICITGAFLLTVINNKTGEKTSNDVSLEQKTVLPAETAVNKKEEIKTSFSNDKKKTIKAGIEEVKNIKDDKKNKIVYTNLYDDIPSSVLPLSAITQISSLPQNVQSVISDISKNSNIYMIQKNNKDKLLIISDNPDNIRHNITFTEVTVSNGHQVKTTLGYNDKMNDSKNDIWEYNNETGQPIRHTKYNADGDMDFVETWNYDIDNPIKYEMKDAAGKVISMRKETLNNGTDLRIEHLLYDKDGNTKINVSTTYEGDDIKRFTYYNADKISESGSVFSDYSEGQKVKETVYTSDLKVKNTYTSDYKDGSRANIIKFDNKNQEVNKYIPATNN